MAPIAFLSSFTGVSLARRCTHGARSLVERAPSRGRHTLHRQRRARPALMVQQPSHRDSVGKAARSRSVVGIVGKAPTKSSDAKVDVESSSGGGLFGMKATAYWESIGVLPLFFASFAIVALGIKMVKVKRGEWQSGPSGVNKVTIPKTAITTEAEEAELHVFKCSGCGYEMYPARGREFKFFPDSFKCPLCGTPKSGFWDLNDPTDPRNQEEDEEEDGDTGTPDIDNEPDGGGPVLVNQEETTQGGDEKGGLGTTPVSRAD